MSEQVRSSITILRRKQVESRTGLSRSSLYAMMAKGNFPSAVSLGRNSRSVDWIEKQIDEWLESLTVKA
ncbi:AlpA family phage regulatory protein [Tunturiibacter gelidiferens]|uniref:AlpA family phage regulatory protein n=1 Tax=Tunturiibacter gelidiferens TaxID=3069689 RepID=UPI003D9B29C3